MSELVTEVQKKKTPQAYFLSAQPDRPAKDSVFVPSNVGVLLRSGRRPTVFSNFGKLDPEKIEVWELPRPYRRLETDGIIYCGIFSAVGEGSKLMIHAATPGRMGILLKEARALIGEEEWNRLSQKSLSFFPERQNKTKDESYQTVVGYNVQIAELKNSDQRIQI